MATLNNNLEDVLKEAPLEKKEAPHNYEEAPDIYTDKDGSLILGEHEMEVLEESEAALDLHKYTGCKKNPHHEKFISIDKLTIQHLGDHRDEDLLQLIKNTARLTVRIDVTGASSRRPKYWPNTTKPYPFHTDKTNLRLGSGIIWDVKETAVRWCTKCKNSHERWEFLVDTAAHVVFNAEEVEHTSLKLFYDSKDSHVVTVDTVRVFKVNIEYDVCLLQGVTCDRSLGQKLRDMWQDFSESWKNVSEKYKDSKEKHRLVYIVSHPHGCPKQVSIGQWVNLTKVEGGNDLYKFTYTTCTCPGSSGANVQCVGFGVDWPDLVHGGCLKSGLNYSATCKPVPI